MNYLHGHDIIGQQRGTTWHYFGTDGLGSNRFMMASSSTISQSTLYSPYGVPMTTTGAVATNLGFTGEHTDPTGLQYLRARYYDPRTAAFLSRDPALGAYPTLSGSWNGYTYAHGNPILYTDPSGQCIFGIATGVCAAAALFVLGAGIEAGTQHVFDGGVHDWRMVAFSGMLGGVSAGASSAARAGHLGFRGGAQLLRAAQFVNRYDTALDIGLSASADVLLRGDDPLTALTTNIIGDRIGRGVLSGMGSAARRIGTGGVCPLNSFSADTLIATPDGDKPISEIEVGDVILAYSEATEEVDIYHVSATHNQRHDSTLDITIDGETLHTTDEHPFYVIRNDEEQWVEAKNLHIGDRVVSGFGETGTVEDIIVINEPQTMYNLTVNLAATYLVGDGQWVVHNENFCPIIKLPQGSLMEQRAVRIKQRYRLDQIPYGDTKTWWTAKNVGLSYHRLTHMAFDDLGGTVAQRQTGRIHAISGTNSSISYHIPNYSGVSHPYFNRTLSEGIRIEEHALLFNHLRQNMPGEGIDRFVDVEAKILEYYGHRLDDRSTGWINLYTMLAPCKSCGRNNQFHSQGVIGQFSDRFPNISLRVFYTYGDYSRLK